ncbi:hypothetical protein RHVG_00049 [Rhodovulum phage RS1]|uniref:tail length tape measure protein n=1 Tax=Rhodobacter phage RC1 TaxID=754055 RepID=UPI0002C18CAD|nr:tail length tape measure protein [Rhodobacter phage RC1]YP_007676428.1 tail length tape measure protein [Rhodovulum phage RS1]AGH58014.1 hypothetical protein RHVG_00049 [Rhodovulum phage RS1]AGH58029.1 hypothetical protein RHWG_00008 [Rhodobacter phage RC1]
MIEAGRYWARGDFDGSIPDEAREDAARFGLDLSEESLAPEPFEIWAEHWPAVSAFLTISTQWRVAASGFGSRYLGLDYSGVEAGLRLAGITLSPEQWDDLRSIEAGAMKELNSG